MVTNMIDMEQHTSKAQQMDHYLESIGVPFGYPEVQHIVQSLFGIDLDTKTLLSAEGKEALALLPVKTNHPLARTLLQSTIENSSKQLNGAEIRQIINQFFGINLDAISALEKARVSIYSKEQWIVQQPRDLFVVHTDPSDITVKIYPTPYFIENTGREELPKALQQALAGLGYEYDEKEGSSSFANPTGEPVEDAFKGRTIGAITQVIQQSYTNI
jgi:hypothetical protein